MSKIHNAMKSGTNSLTNPFLDVFNPFDGDKALRLTNKTPKTLFDLIHLNFNKPTIRNDSRGNGGVIFDTGINGISIGYYPIDNSFGTPAMEILKNGVSIYKFRT